MTRPTVWKLPRSISLVTTAGLMSTQTVATDAGSRFPTAIECSIVESISATPTPSRMRARIASLGLDARR